MPLLKIGLIDADNEEVFKKGVFPNLPLMKLSAWHKAKGDFVEWWRPDARQYDIVYISKVFSFSEDPTPKVKNALQIFRGGADTP